MWRFIKNEKCRKCGSSDIALFYHKEEAESDSLCYKENLGEQEHICHHCRVCGYVWITKCLHHKANKKQEESIK